MVRDTLAPTPCCSRRAEFLWLQASASVRGAGLGSLVPGRSEESGFELKRGRLLPSAIYLAR